MVWLLGTEWCLTLACGCRGWASFREDWAADELERSVVREREGRRPLLTGDVGLPASPSILLPVKIGSCGGVRNASFHFARSAAGVSAGALSM